MHLGQCPMVPLCTAFSQAREGNLATCRSNPEMWSLCPQSNPHPIEDESLWLNVSTSWSSRGIILSTDHVINTFLIVFLFVSLSLHFPTVLFSVITSKMKSLYQVFVSGSALNSKRRCSWIQGKTP